MLYTCTWKRKEKTVCTLQLKYFMFAGMLSMQCHVLETKFFAHSKEFLLLVHMHVIDMNEWAHIDSLTCSSVPSTLYLQYVFQRATLKAARPTGSSLFNPGVTKKIKAGLIYKSTSY